MFTHGCSSTVGRAWGDSGRVSASHMGLTRVWRESWSKLTSCHCSHIFPQASVAKCPSEYSGIQGQVFKWFVWPGAAKTQEPTAAQFNRYSANRLGGAHCGHVGGARLPSGGFPFRLSMSTGGVVRQRGSTQEPAVRRKRQDPEPHTQFVQSPLELLGMLKMHLEEESAPGTAPAPLTRQTDFYTFTIWSWKFW